MICQHTCGGRCIAGCPGTDYELAVRPIILQCHHLQSQCPRGEFDRFPRTDSQAQPARDDTAGAGGCGCFNTMRQRLDCDCGMPAEHDFYHAARRHTDTVMVQRFFKIQFSMPGQGMRGMENDARVIDVVFRDLKPGQVGYVWADAKICRASTDASDDFRGKDSFKATRTEWCMERKPATSAGSRAQTTAGLATILTLPLTAVMMGKNAVFPILLFCNECGSPHGSTRQIHFTIMPCSSRIQPEGTAGTMRRRMGRGFLCQSRRDNQAARGLIHQAAPGAGLPRLCTRTGMALSCTTRSITLPAGAPSCSLHP